MEHNSEDYFTTLSDLSVSNIQQISNNSVAPNLPDGEFFSYLNVQIELNERINLLERLVNQLGSTEDNIVLRTELHELQQKTNKLAKDCNDRIKELSRFPQSSNSLEQKERKLLKARITENFLEVLNKFQDLQRTASQKEKQHIIRETKIKSNNPFYTNDETSFESTANSSEPVAVLQVQQLDEERNNLELAKAQHEAIRRLESDIADVNQIFQDLGRMIHEQQDTIDNIENNVQTGQFQIEAGNQELQRAAEYQKRARKKKLLIVIILVVILVVIIIIIYMTTNKL